MINSRFGPIAQRLEQATHNRLVTGSNPVGPTTRTHHVSQAYATPFLIFFTAMVMIAAGCSRQNSDSRVTGIAAGHQQSWFQDFTERSGIRFVHQVETTGNYLYSESIGSGAAFLDFDNDGRLDVLLIHNVNPSSEASNRLFQQSSDGRFHDVSAGSGLDVSGYGNGVVVGDLNNDGLPEVLLTEYDRLRLFLNLGHGKFTDVTAAAGLTNDYWSVSASFFDYDRDGWLDLIVGNYLDFDPSQKCFDAKGQQDFCGPHGFHSTITRLYHNLGAGTPVSSLGDRSSVNLPKSAPTLPRFKDVTLRSGFSRAPGKAMAVVCADFDGDFFADVFVTDDGLPNRLFINQRDGTFKEEALQRGLAYTGTGAALANMGIAIGDVDGDGLFDLFVPHLSEENHTLWRHGPRGSFQDHTAESGLLAARWHGTGFAPVLADFDCNGAVDLAVANGAIRRSRSRRGSSSVAVGNRSQSSHHASRVASQIAEFWRPYAEPSQLFANDGAGHFREISSANSVFCDEATVGRGLVCGDIDNDGGLDLLLTGIAGPARLYRNVASRGHWLGIRAILPNLGGRDAYGAEIIVQAGGRRWWRLVQPCYGYASSHDPRVHVGLGAVARIDSITVRWPDGMEERFEGGEPDRYLVLRQGSRRAE
jgi:enediyne biosynthesis protein E4